MLALIDEEAIDEDGGDGGDGGGGKMVDIAKM